MTYQPNRRDKIVVIVANAVLRLATRQYQDLLKGLIVSGMSQNPLGSGKPTT